jgi:hypothetical protein
MTEKSALSSTLKFHSGNPVTAEPSPGPHSGDEVAPIADSRAAQDMRLSGKHVGFQRHLLNVNAA